MASTYSTDLRLELIGSGEQSGVWGSTTNLNLGSLVEQAIAGVESIVVPSADYALETFYGAVDESRNAVLVLSSGAAANVYVPPVNKVYVVKNTGSYAITMYNSTVVGNTTAAGAGVTVASNTSILLFTDGGNFSSVGLPAGSTTGTGSVVYSASPTLTGTPLAPTAAVGTDTTQIATTAFVRDIIPTGIISLWYGSVASIPSGWYLCNGSNGTPDLRDRFIVGAGSTYAVAATGGSANATLVSHTHTATSAVTDAGHDHATHGQGTIYDSGNGQSYYLSNSDSSFSGGGGALFGRSLTVDTDMRTSSNTTGVTVATTNSTEGSSATNANLPPYYALAYIMKA